MSISFAFADEPTDFFSNLSGIKRSRECWGWFHYNISRMLDLENRIFLFAGPSKILLTNSPNPTFPSGRYFNFYNTTIGRFLWEHKEFFQVLAEELGVSCAFVKVKGYKYPFMVGTFGRANYRWHHFNRNFWRIANNKSVVNDTYVKEGYDAYLNSVCAHLGGVSYCGFSQSYIPQEIQGNREYLDILFSPKAAKFIGDYMKKDYSYYNSSLGLQKYILLNGGEL